MDIESFIARWQRSGGSERANYQLFLSELTRLLDLPVPEPATGLSDMDAYRFDHPVTYGPLDAQTRGFVDLYRKHCFVLETKQGTDADWASDGARRVGHGTRGSRRMELAMHGARQQAERYAKGLARKDGWPPFLLVVDVGHVVEVYADFSDNGHGYSHFPDAGSFRIRLTDLHDAKVRERLRLIWTDPKALNPALHAARVTREVSAQLAELGKSLENRGLGNETVARYLMRCLFTMFAEDVRLIPADSFRAMLEGLRGHPEDAGEALSGLWAAMDKGEYAHGLQVRVKTFNGGLFRDTTAFPLLPHELSLLIGAAAADWRDVEPAIFGTLLERALDSRQRHRLGAHYTPRAYVERLVVPTVIDPLRADWDGVRASALIMAQNGATEAARELIKAFRDRLCALRILDPACGSGNFLYVTMELMKRLEGEITGLLADLGEAQPHLSLEGHTIDPHQFLGIEVNPWAAAVAELVLWIGYLQWHFRAYGNASPAEPVLRDFKNIENRDAVLTWAGTRPRTDDAGKPVTRWDGETKVVHPVTGEQVPDPDARVAVLDYLKPQPAKWPEADFIVGNPPFIGASRMRDALGDGYAEALWQAYPRMPQSADFVMFWWDKAALATRGWKPATDKARARGTRRFGFITTNSLRQTFNRKVLEPHLSDPKTPLSLTFAIPDHPWVDAGDGAAVRIAMTVAEAGKVPGRLGTVIDERKGEYEAEGRPVRFDIEKGKIFADLRIGADVAGAVPLKANEGLAFMGVKLHGVGFVISEGEARNLAERDKIATHSVLRDYWNGRDFVGTPRGVKVIDLFGLAESEALTRFPNVVQVVMDRVRPERLENNRETYRKNWWIFGEPRRELRPALSELGRFVATVQTSKHAVFQFLPERILPDATLIAICLNDAWWLGVVSSRIHVTWALSAGGWLGVGNDPRYNHSRCFNPFPFPDPTEAQKTRLRSLGEQLDAHRKAQQKAHPKLTLTAMYNVLEKLRAGERIEGRDRETYDQGLIGILRDLHDQIDAEVARAYGWPADLSDDAILHRLVDLNRERAAEEARGHIRWLRPDYQNPGGQVFGATGQLTGLDINQPVMPGQRPWPRDLPAQVVMVQAALAELGTASPATIARQFKGVRASTVETLLETLTAIQFARRADGGQYMT